MLPVQPTSASRSLPALAFAQSLVTRIPDTSTNIHVPDLPGLHTVPLKEEGVQWDGQIFVYPGCMYGSDVSNIYIPLAQCLYLLTNQLGRCLYIQWPVPKDSAPLHLTKALLLWLYRPNLSPYIRCSSMDTCFTRLAAYIPLDKYLSKWYWWTDECVCQDPVTKLTYWIHIHYRSGAIYQLRFML